MPRLFAFLRAINVGGHTVSMGRLQQACTELGCAGVETFLASGNVIFASRSPGGAALERRLAAGLEGALGFPVDVFLRTPTELAALAGPPPFSAADEAEAHALYVGLLHAAPPTATMERVLALRSATDDFHLRGRELWWLRRARESAGKLVNGTFEKALGASATFRNVTTLRRLAARFGRRGP